MPAMFRELVDMKQDSQAEGTPVSVKIRESHERALPMLHLDPRHKLTQEFEALYGLLAA